MAENRKVVTTAEGNSRSPASRRYFLLPARFLFFAIVAQQNLTRHVDPFIGIGGHGHTYPGATMPFAMVQLSPDTRVMRGLLDLC